MANKIVDLTGWVMKEHGVEDSKITVLYKLPERKNYRVVWHCKCDCGKEFDAIGTRIKSGAVKSCGCLHKEHAAHSYIDITNQRFGKLVALYPVGVNKGRTIMWHCQCDCGNECDIDGSLLRRGITNSCGCLRSSKGEFKIQQILEDNNISFEKEKTFEDCKDKRLLPFDFYIDNKYIIEYDGVQHFESSTGSMWNTENKVQITQEHDNIKNQYCKVNNIPIIRIPYTHYNDLYLEDLMLETSKFLLNEDEK